MATRTRLPRWRLDLTLFLLVAYTLTFLAAGIPQSKTTFETLSQQQHREMAAKTRPPRRRLDLTLVDALESIKHPSNLFTHPLNPQAPPPPFPTLLSSLPPCATMSTIITATQTLPFPQILFVSSFTSNEVLEVDIQKRTVTVVASGIYCDKGDGPSALGPCTVVDGPWGVALGGQDLYVSNFGTDQVLVFDVHTGEFGGALGDSEVLDSPEGLAFGPDGLLYVSSYLSNEVVQFNVTTGASRVFAGEGMLKGPEGMAFLDDGTMLIASHFNNGVVAIDRSGTQQKFFGVDQNSTRCERGACTPMMVQIAHPVGITRDPLSGIVFVTSYSDNKLFQFTQDGLLLKVLNVSGKRSIGAKYENEEKLAIDSGAVRSKVRLRGVSSVCLTEGGAMWVAGYDSSTVSIFRATTGGDIG